MGTKKWLLLAIYFNVKIHRRQFIMWQNNYLYNVKCFSTSVFYWGLVVTYDVLNRMLWRHTATSARPSPTWRWMLKAPSSSRSGNGSNPEFWITSGRSGSSSTPGRTLWRKATWFRFCSGLLKTAGNFTTSDFGWSRVTSMAAPEVRPMAGTDTTHSSKLFSISLN